MCFRKRATSRRWRSASITRWNRALLPGWRVPWLAAFRDPFGNIFHEAFVRDRGCAACFGQRNALRQQATLGKGATDNSHGPMILFDNDLDTLLHLRQHRM